MQPLPEVARKILEITQNENCSASEIEQLICLDPTLTAKTLRIVNSAFYGLSGQVTSISHAVIVLGIKQLRNLVLSLATISLVKASDPAIAELQREIWLHSFGAAAGAQIIAKRKKLHIRDVETAFTGALLQDIGLLFLSSKLPEAYLRVVASKEAGDDVSDAEHAIIGMTHAMLGARVASYWQLPESLVDSILRHECAMDFAGEPTLLSIQVGSVAATYASGTATDINVEEILAWLQLTDEGWQEIVEVVEGRTQAASEFLGVLFA